MMTIKARMMKDIENIIAICCPPKLIQPQPSYIDSLVFDRTRLEYTSKEKLRLEFSKFWLEFADGIAKWFLTATI